MWHTEKQKKLTPSQQFLFLKSNPVCSGNGSVKKGKLSWQYEVEPSPLSRIYSVEIILRANESPDIFVRNPNLSLLAKGRDIPHVYHDPLRLCLYLPRKRQWHERLRLDQTIVPWAALWLYYFEEWLVSDEWKGGGEHPDSNDRHSRENRHLRRFCSKIGLEISDSAQTGH